MPVHILEKDRVQYSWIMLTVPARKRILLDVRFLDGEIIIADIQKMFLLNAINVRYCHAVSVYQHRKMLVIFWCYLKDFHSTNESINSKIFKISLDYLLIEYLLKGQFAQWFLKQMHLDS